MEHTRISADIALPELTVGRFIDLYPLLPYQIDLIIQIVSGLRTQGGASAHVGGANRTIIKIAQQLLINPATKLADCALGALATIDQIYDLISGNISWEIRGKIQDITTKIANPMAQKVAKAICLLQFVKSVHRTVENIGASLLPSVDSDSVLPIIKDAIEELIKGHYIRHGDDGFRIPTPAEDDWERQRAEFSPQPGDENRILGDVIKGLWEPQPAYNLASTKLFKSGLFFNGRRTVEGDIDFFIVLAAEGSDFTNQETEMRSRSRSDTKSVFWAWSNQHFNHPESPGGLSLARNSLEEGAGCADFGGGTSGRRGEEAASHLHGRTPAFAERLDAVGQRFFSR